MTGGETKSRDWLLKKNLVFVSIVLVVAGSIAGIAIGRTNSSTAIGALTTCTFNPTGLVIPAVSNSTAFRIAETSSQFMSLIQGKSVEYSGAAASIHCNTVESIDANFIVTDNQGGKEDVIVSMAVGQGNVPNGTVISVQIRPYASFGGP